MFYQLAKPTPKYNDNPSHYVPKRKVQAFIINNVNTSKLRPFFNREHLAMAVGGYYIKYIKT